MNDQGGEASKGRAKWLAPALALGLVLSLVVRMAALDDREVWLDESHSALLAGMSVADLLEFVRGDVHPPLYFFLLNGWRRLAGDSELALRGFSVLASTLAGLVFLSVSLRVFGRGWAAVVACWLFWLSPVLVYYGVEVRMYAVASLWAAVIVLGLQRLLSAPDRDWRSGAVLIVVGGGLGFFTHYIMLFLLAGLGAFLLFEAAKRRVPTGRVLAIGAALALTGSVWLPTLLTQRAAKAELRRTEMVARADSTSLSFGTDSNPDRGIAEAAREALENAASAAGVFPDERPWLLALLALPIVLTILWGVLHAGRLLWSRALLFAGAVTLLGGIAAGITARRFLVVLVPFLVLALAEAWSDLARRRPRMAQAGGVLLVGLYLAGAIRVVRAEPVRPTSTIVRFLGEALQPGDVLIVEALYYETLLEYHARQAGVSLPVDGFPVGVRTWWASQPFKGWGGPVIRRGELEAFVHAAREKASTRRIWLILFETRYYDPRGELLRAFESRSAQVTPLLPEIARQGQRLYRIDLTTREG